MNSSLLLVTKYVFCYYLLIISSYYHLCPVPLLVSIKKVDNKTSQCSSSSDVPQCGHSSLWMQHAASFHRGYCALPAMVIDVSGLVCIYIYIYVYTHILIYIYIYIYTQMCIDMLCMETTFMCIYLYIWCIGI